MFSCDRLVGCGGALRLRRTVTTQSSFLGLNVSVRNFGGHELTAGEGEDVLEAVADGIKVEGGVPLVERGGISFAMHSLLCQNWSLFLAQGSRHSDGGAQCTHD